MNKIINFESFTDTLLDRGFSMGGGNSEGIYAIIPWGWNESAPYDTPIKWHTGDAETDPWEWRMRVLDDRNDIAYAKLFFKKSGFITRKWYPYFLAARRGDTMLESEYWDGSISQPAKRIYDVIAASEALPVEQIKMSAGFTQENKSVFDRALVELQMKLYITMCGRRRRSSKIGEEYGWASTVFCTAERFWEQKVFEEARAITKEDAINAITEQIITINPLATPKKIAKFICP